MDTTHNVLIRSLMPRNLLSFGPEFQRLQLEPLNVLIGANASGKSNILEVLQVLRSAPKDMEPVFRKGGGIGEWIWKGNLHGNASIDCVVRREQPLQHVRHVLSFGVASQRLQVFDERIEDAFELQSESFQRYYVGVAEGTPSVFYLTLDGERSWTNAPTSRPHTSILSFFQDEMHYPELHLLSQSYNQIRIYREWSFGRNAVFRTPQKADMRNDVLEEDFSNLGLVLNRLKTKFPAAKRAILNGLKDLYDGIQDFDVMIEGGTVQVFFTEGDFVIPATRLSDGTLRYLCLLAILCDPTPPPLICIEEPELGLHPDILPNLADLLIAASERTQLVITTHSDILVDAMTERPDAVVVCEKHDGKTEMNRLSPEALAVWLEKYRLGQLWIDGQLGGKRW